MNDEPSPDPRRVARARVHLLVVLMLLISWVGAFLAGRSAGFDAYESSEKATAVAIAGLAGMSVYFLILMPTNMDDVPMSLTWIPFVSIQLIRPTRTPVPFAHFLAHAVLANLMMGVVFGWLRQFWPSPVAARNITTPPLRDRRRELEVRPVKSSVVRSYLEAGLTERGREESP